MNLPFSRKQYIENELAFLDRYKRTGELPGTTAPMVAFGLGGGLLGLGVGAIAKHKLIGSLIGAGVGVGTQAINRLGQKRYYDRLLLLSKSDREKLLGADYDRLISKLSHESKRKVSSRGRH